MDPTRADGFGSELGRVANLSEYLASVLPRVRLRRRIAPCAAKKPSAASAPATGCQCPVHHADNSPFVDGAVVQLQAGAGEDGGKGRAHRLRLANLKVGTAGA